MSMYVSDCTNVYMDPSEGYPTPKEACQNCTPYTIDDLGPPVGRCSSAVAVENFQVFDNNKGMNVVKLLLILVLLGLIGYGAYKLINH